MHLARWPIDLLFAKLLLCWTQYFCCNVTRANLRWKIFLIRDRFLWQEIYIYKKA